MHSNDDPMTLRRPLRLLGHLGLLAWVGFWSWFVISVMASEGPAVVPVVMLLGLWLVAALAWLRPRSGALALVALGAWSLWFFHDPFARWHVSLWLIALPASAIAVCIWLGAPPRRQVAPQLAS